MVYSATQDMTAAWYAAAPPPPPPPTAKAQKRASMAPSYGGVAHVHGDAYRAKPALRTSSSSQSFGYDRHAAGDNLPADTYAPEPERPVSRNAMARQRERERQRTRTNSTSGYAAPNGEQLHAATATTTTMLQANGAPPPARSPSPAPRVRRESSPAAAESWNGHAQLQQPQQQYYHQQPAYQTSQQQYVYPAYAGHAPSVHGYSAPPTPASTVYAPSPVATTTPQGSWQASGYPQYAPQQHPVPYHQAPPTPVVDYRHAGHVAPSPPSQAPYATAFPAAYGAAGHSGYASAPQTPFQGQTWPQQYAPPTYGPVVNGAAQPVVAIGKSPKPHAQSAVPFPSAAMPPPPVPSPHPHPASAHGTPPSVSPAQARPLPSPSSRSSSQSSSVGTRNSTASLGSVSGTVRRSLPQPPSTAGQRYDSQPSTPSPQAAASSIRTTSDAAPLSTLGRNDSVRMAAEELMARGPPRRKGIPSRMRARGGQDSSSGSSSINTSNGSNAHANTSRSDGSISDGIVTGASPYRSGPPSSAAVQAAPRGRAESASCLEREMRAMKLQQSDSTAATTPYAIRAPLASVQSVAQQHVGVPANDYPVRASSPRPVRAAPPPAPQVTVDSPVIDMMPSRPMSRGPKDDNERRRSVEVCPQQTMRAPSFGIPQIRSPPPDRKPPVPSIMFDEDEPARRGGVPPSIVVPSIMLPGAEEEAANNDAAAPHICISSDSLPADKPAPSISISVSSSGLAQRSTTSQTPPSSSRASPFTVPEPASAPSVGSGAGCATCKKWIGGRVVHALSHTFHPDCFVCVHCSEPLEHVAFYEHDGQPYCHFDFHELFSKRCFHCRTPIVDQRYITINDVELVGNGGHGEAQQERCYHDTHFFCANCGDPFMDPKVAASAAGADVLQAEIEDENGVVRYGGREFAVHKGYPYCEPCHVSLHKPRCKGCTKPIVDEEYLTALRAKWHVGCFSCQRCRQPIDTDNFFVRDGVAYDEECYKIKLRSEL